MSISQTQQIAEKLAASITPDRRIFALVGDLGAGKTTFSRFFLRALGITESVTSPTFVIMKNYALHNAQFTRACHIDCYRLHTTDELVSLGFKDLLEDKKTIVLIEWADRVRSILPKDTVWIDFNHEDVDTRGITIRTT